MARFPYMPMLAIMMTVVTTMVSQMNLISYAGSMVQHLGVVDDKDKAGYYSGLLLAAVMVGYLVSSRLWGLASDRYGCRFVMIFGLCATATLSLALGVSPTFGWAVGLRFLAGLLNGTMVACKTIVSDVCGKEHATVGMGVVTAAFSMGQVIGPGVGGILSEPAKHHSGTFSESGIFGRYPYLLPNVVVSGMALVSLPLVLLFLEGRQIAENGNRTSCPRVWSCFYWGRGDERDNSNGGGKIDKSSATKSTSGLPIGADGNGIRLPSWMQRETVPTIATQNEPVYANERLERDAKGSKPKSLLRQQHIRVLLVIDALYSLTYSGLEAVFTLWALSTVAKGGLDWSAVDIGKVFFACGVMLLVFELIAVPVLSTRLGVRLCQRLGSVVELPIYFIIPLLSRMSSSGFLVPIAAVLLFLVLAGSYPFYIGVSLAINNATAPDRRGELNWISFTSSCVARSLSRVVFSALFAYSIDGNHPFPFDHHLAFYCVALFRLTVACMGWNRLCDKDGVGEAVMIFGE